MLAALVTDRAEADFEPTGGSVQPWKTPTLPADGRTLREDALNRRPDRPSRPPAASLDFTCRCPGGRDTDQIRNRPGQNTAIRQTGEGGAVVTRHGQVSSLISAGRRRVVP